MTSVATADTKQSADTSRRLVIAALVGYALMVVLAGVVVAIAYSRAYKTESFLHGPRWLDGWFQFDSGWYYGIAANGYSFTPGQQSSVAFFPTYPMLVRGLGSLFGDYQLMGTLLTLLAGAGAIALFAAWTARLLPARSARTAVLLLLLYPYSYFLYGSMYADALFLLTAMAAFALLERRAFWLAGLVGALATAGRPVGIAVAIGLIVRVVELRAEQARAAQRDPTDTAAEPQWQRRVSPTELVRGVRLLRWPDLGVFASLLGLAGWCLYLWLTFGNPLAFLVAESAPGWDQGAGPRTWFKIAFFGHLRTFDPRVSITLAVQAAACVVALLLLRRVFRRFGWGYLAFCLVAVAIPVIGTKDFMGTGRYLLAAFPAMAAAGDWLASTRHTRWLRPLLLSLCAVGMLLGAGLYSRGFELS
ncbi:MAG: hypothetical protein ACOYBY_02670 [Dermatophilaceae bacterium]